MPADAHDVQAPATLWVRRVGTQHRIRLHGEAAETVKWLKGKAGFAIDCIARLGPAAQLQILPKDREEAAKHKLNSSLKAAPPNVDEIAAPWTELARYFATGWTIPCSFEEKSNRFTFVLPKEARDLGIVPGENEVVAIFSTGEILEVWPAREWTQHVAKISSNLNQITILALDALQSREEAW